MNNKVTWHWSTGDVFQETAGAWKHAVHCNVGVIFRKVGVFPNVGVKQKQREWANLLQFTPDPLRIALNMIAVNIHFVYEHVN